MNWNISFVLIAFIWTAVTEDKRRSQGESILSNSYKIKAAGSRFGRNKHGIKRQAAEPGESIFIPMLKRGRYRIVVLNGLMTNQPSREQFDEIFFEGQPSGVYDQKSFPTIRPIFLFLLFSLIQL